MGRSRIPNFYKMSRTERIAVLEERGVVSGEDMRDLLNGQHTLSVDAADRMVENVIGVFGLPLGAGLNFLVNGKDYVVPFAVEEPSIIAAVSSAAKLIRAAGGFQVEAPESLLKGQIQVVGLQQASVAQQAILQNKHEILNLANSLHPKMVARGGGAVDVETVIHTTPGTRQDMLVVNLLVNTCDAMGANMVNTMCEGVAPLVEKITSGKVFLRILSNLTDRSMVRACAKIPVALLEGKGYTGSAVRDGIVLANEFAIVDANRATTHNKGIMNGIDAVAIATGNDWRAIEAAAHAYAGRGSSYTSLTQWSKADDGSLLGVLEIPLKVGIVGGNLRSNPTVSLSHRMLQVETATELACVMGAVGLAQNFSALRALVTEGIQRGHMSLHARSVAASAGATPDIFDTVVERLIESGEIKVWKAEEIIRELAKRPTFSAEAASPQDGESSAQLGLPAGFGKVILIGEHAAVYGKHVVAAPISLTVEAKIEDAAEGVDLLIPRWGVEQRLSFQGDHQHSLHRSLGLVLDRLGLRGRGMRIEVFPQIPRAMGLGGSAAMAVAIIRALDAHYRLGMLPEQINDLAYECEKIAHGTPSGIDNTMATYGRPMLYRRGEQPVRTELQVKEPIPIVIGLTGVESLTAKMVAKVRQAWERNSDLYERIFGEIDTLALEAVDAMREHRLEYLGELMNICQGLLNGLQVSSRELEALIEIARQNGALGAKLTGAGGGGSMIALCPNDPQRVAQAIQAAGYRAMIAHIG